MKKSLVFIWILIALFIAAPQCQPKSPQITIDAPVTDSTTGSCPVEFHATLVNVTEELFLTLSVMIDDVGILGDGEVTIGDQVVTISNLLLTTTEAGFKACNLPVGSHVFTVSVGEGEEQVTQSAGFVVQIDHRSCLEILAAEGSFGDGLYLIDPDGAEGVDFEAFEVLCDMTTDGGGWTGISLEIAALNLGSDMVAVDPAATAGITSDYKPYTRDQSDNHTYHYTIATPFGFTQFFLSGYKAKANASGSGNTSDIYPSDFKQSSWSKAYLEGGVGDVSFGSADEPGPITSFAKVLTSNFDCADCELPWPNDKEIYSVTSAASGFRMGWGESGPQYEGWYPWWDGMIFIR